MTIRVQDISVLETASMYSEHLSQPFFDDIQSGKKKFEGRLVKKIWASLKEGDIIRWYNSDKGSEETFFSIVVSLQKFKTFAEAIESVGLENILPSEIGNSIEDAVKNVYRIWYNAEDEKKYGVVLVGF